MTFKRYAPYYDAFYQGKDYEAECDFLEQIFARYAQVSVRTILDLGCGTGGHVLPLARRGYEVMGIDCSEEMLAEARRKASTTADRRPQTTDSDDKPAFATVGGPSFVVFRQGDIRHLDLGRTFDAVIAIFAVISYQTTNEDLTTAFHTVRRHLRPRGLFVFDAWFGPAVLTVRPEERVKIIERNGERIIRIAIPVMDILTQTVRVNYKVLRLRDGRVLDEVDESHRMRFLFPQEVIHHLKEVNIAMVRICAFPELARDLCEHDWNMAFIGKAI